MSDYTTWHGWRSEIADAQARKRQGLDGFTLEARKRARLSGTCAVGETMHGAHDAYTDTVLAGEMAVELWGVTFSRQGNGHSCLFTNAVLRDDPDVAERLLDLIEDRALRLKREALT